MTSLQPVGESQVAKALVGEFAASLADCLDNDAVVVGAGPAGLTAARYLAKGGAKTLLIERNNFAGGGAWSGGFLFPKFLVEEPAHELVREVGARLRKVADHLYVADPAEVVAKGLAAALDAGARFLNNVVVEDVIFRQESEQRAVAGVVVNWFPTTLLPPNLTCYDPIGIGAKVVVDATGHDAAVVSLVSKKLGSPTIAGVGAMNTPEAEGLVVERTGEVFPNLMATGMAVAAVYGLPRMGPIYGGMLLSGRRVAELALEKLGLAAPRPPPQG